MIEKPWRTFQVPNILLFQKNTKECVLKTSLKNCSLRNVFKNVPINGLKF